ncbi:MAG TPA: DUF1702 family protein [Pyrinomonadaceae bacterium]
MFAIKSFAAPSVTTNKPVTRLRKHLFGISFEEVTFARRGFNDSGCAQRERLEHIGRTFLLGYHAALCDEGPEVLAANLETVGRESCGFAYEGAAMGLTLLDHLSFRKRGRLLTFLNGAGARHTYMVHVGVGWAIARIPWLRRNFQHSVAHLDPLLRWLAADGNGFSDFYFKFPDFLRQPERLNKIQGYARHAYAQGIGRSLWFVTGAKAHLVSEYISRLPQPLHGDLWSGVGLASAMAGGSDHVEIELVRSLAQDYRPAVAQGAAFAAKARQRANNTTDHTEIACQILCGVNADAAAKITDAMLQDLPDDGKVPAYEVWRQRIQSQLSRS